jgi:hypothetical protein
MNLSELQRKLIAAARSTPPSDRVPFAFEKRILAQLKSVPGLDMWTLWGHALWRATAPCLAVMLLLSTWALFVSNANAPSSNGLSNSDDLSQEFENTVLAAANQEQLADSNW